MRWIASILAAIHRRPGLILAVYWPIIFVGTHLPRFGPLRGEPRRYPYDKLAHFACYAILAWLLMLLLLRRVRLTTAILSTCLLVAAYGVVDELTQPIIGRTADLWDYVANLAGIAMGVLTAAAWPRLRPQSAPEETHAE